MLDTWMHVSTTMSCDGHNSTNNMYINGVLMASSTWSGAYVEEGSSNSYFGGIGANMVIRPIDSRNAFYLLDKGFLGFIGSFKYFEGTRSLSEI